jgi:tRNA-Thr(GGU) m(6)t(6)A37 methyltransferase TsaA
MKDRKAVIDFRPIGVIRTPFRDVASMPIQPRGAIGVQGTVEVAPEFVEGLSDLEGFSHVILVYSFHKAPSARLRVTPFLDDRERGVFATRAPARPNPIGLSVVRLVAIRGNLLEVENVDILDGTPLLDIKPYVPAFDAWATDSLGWLAERQAKVAEARSDGRFRKRASRLKTPKGDF